MTVIERIKDELDQRKPWTEFDSDIALLVEYYEAAEAWFKVEPYTDIGPELDRLNKARAKLEAQDG